PQPRSCNQSAWTRAPITGSTPDQKPGSVGTDPGAGGVKSGGLSHSLSHFAMRESVDSRHGAMGARSIGGVRFPRSQTGTSMTNQPISMADRPTGERQYA